MSKVISFSISDRYLSQIKALYPALTDNLAVKKFLTDRLDDSLGNSLDDVVKKSIGELTERLSRLEERLDDSLDGRLDAMEQLLKLQREASIATSQIPSSSSPAIADDDDDETGETGDSDSLLKLALKLDRLGDQASIDAIESQLQDDDNEENYSTVESGPGAIENENPETSPINGEDRPAIETLTDSKPWSTLDDLLDCHYPGWPETKEGLRKKALRENWPKRTQRGSKGQPYEYQVVLPE